MQHEQVQSNVKILAKAKWAINICKAHACLRFLFISLRACAPWCLLLSLHMEASPKDHSQSTPQKRILFQSSVVTGSGVIFLLCLLLLAASISASLKTARGLFCCCLVLEGTVVLNLTDENNLRFSLLCLWTTVCGTGSSLLYKDYNGFVSG